jgi:alanyl-tRNA synthetase
MDQNVMQTLVVESAVEVNGRKTIPCARAFELHRQHGIPLREIGRICDEKGIRICACQLGCFR